VTAFDLAYALSVGIPLATAAYTVMSGDAVLPAGFEQSALIQADTPTQAGHLAKAMLRDTNIFGLTGHNGATRFVALRGTETLAEWLQDFTVTPTGFGPYGDVADGFLDVYQLMRASIMAAVHEFPIGPLLVIGHSLGGALAVLAAIDIAKTVGIDTSVLTFAAPKVGCKGFTAAANAAVSSCFQVANFLDIVPHVPLPPFEHAGTVVRVDSGGPIGVPRHLLPAYRAGLAKLK
jgi:triacylglycerol lipase